MHRTKYFLKIEKAKLLPDVELCLVHQKFPSSPRNCESCIKAVYGGIGSNPLVLTMQFIVVEIGPTSPPTPVHPPSTLANDSKAPDFTPNENKEGKEVAIITVSEDGGGGGLGGANSNDKKKCALI